MEPGRRPGDFRPWWIKSALLAPVSSRTQRWAQREGDENPACMRLEMSTIAHKPVSEKLTQKCNFKYWRIVNCSSKIRAATSMRESVNFTARGNNVRPVAPPRRLGGRGKCGSRFVPFTCSSWSSSWICWQLSLLHELLLQGSPLPVKTLRGLSEIIILIPNNNVACYQSHQCDFCRTVVQNHQQEALLSWAPKSEGSPQPRGTARGPPVWTATFRATMLSEGVYSDEELFPRKSHNSSFPTPFGRMLSYQILRKIMPFFVL